MGAQDCPYLFPLNTTMTAIDPQRTMYTTSASISALVTRSFASAAILQMERGVLWQDFGFNGGQ